MRGLSAIGARWRRGKHKGKARPEPQPVVQFPPRVAARWQPWETAKPEERATLLTITNTIGEEWAHDEPVVFLAGLEEMNLAALWAIRLELATWGYNDLN